ncbi:MAG: hypothetical protein ACREUG_05840 [Steroidobacteraceae bacterium]
MSARPELSTERLAPRELELIDRYWRAASYNLHVRGHKERGDREES